jgi:glutathione-regulated potassium-efflux system protein KefB
MNKPFNYEQAFSRNIGWVTQAEQQQLRGKRVAIAGGGGVGGVHLLTLARLGVSRFHIADFDSFDIANFNRQVGAMMSAIVILSMALTPLTSLLTQRLLPKPTLSAEDADGVEFAKDLRGQVLIIGFGRFAQVVSQPLLARDVDVSIIENDVEMIQAASQFGFKVYYGDGAQLHTLRASGAEEAEIVLVCVDKPEVADRIVELVKSEFPTTKIMARAFDRGHSMRLIQAGVDYQIRETFESALKFGERALVELGMDEHEAAETIGDVRRRDEARLDLQLTGGITAGRQLMRGNMPTPQPAPYIKPRREGRLLNEEEAGPSVPAAEDEPVAS